MKQYFVFIVLTGLLITALSGQQLQLINEAALSQKLDSDSVLVQARVSVTTDVTTCLGVDILGLNAYDWYGGDKVQVEPGTSIVEIEFPIFYPFDENDDLFWNLFLTPPGMDWTSATKNGAWTPFTLADGGLSPGAEDSVKIVAAPRYLKPGDETIVNVAYELTGDSVIQLDLIGGNGETISASSAFVKAGSGVTVLSASIDQQPEGAFTYRASFTTQESIDIVASSAADITTSPPNQFYANLADADIPKGDPLNLHFSYNADQAFQFCYDIYTIGGQWLKGDRVDIPEGTNTASEPVDISEFEEGEYRIVTFMVPPNQSWTETVYWGLPIYFNVVEPEPMLLTDGELTVPQTWVTVEGEEVSVDRKALVHVPEDTADEVPLPVLIVLHGSDAFAPDMLFTYRYVEDRILVSCQGYQAFGPERGGDWNISYDATQAPDVDFIREIILQLRTFENVDSSNIAILGYSNGAGFLNRLMIELEDGMFQTGIGIAQQLRTIQYRDDQFWFDPNGRWDYTDTIVPPAGRRFLYIHGSNDEILDTDGLYLPDPSVDLWTTAVDSIFAWAKASSGDANLVKLEEADGEVGPDGKIWSYLNGQVEYHRLDNTGHFDISELMTTKDLIVNFLASP